MRAYILVASCLVLGLLPTSARAGDCAAATAEAQLSTLLQAGQPTCATAKTEEEAKACFIDMLQKSVQTPGQQELCTDCRNQQTNCNIWAFTCGPWYALCWTVCCNNFNTCSGANCGPC